MKRVFTIVPPHSAIIALSAMVAPRPPQLAYVVESLMKRTFTSGPQLHEARTLPLAEVAEHGGVRQLELLGEAAHRDGALQ